MIFGPGWMIYIDSGAYIARYIQRDQYHRDASRHWRRLAGSAEVLVTSNHVVDEVLTYLGRVAGNRFAAERGRTIYGSASLSVLRSDEEIEKEAIEDYERYADQAVSFTDCISFVLMRRRSIDQAFTYDRHFAMAGFTIWNSEG